MFPKSSNSIKLNVGGQIFQTSQQTLLLHGQTFFSSLINNSIKGDDSEYFIDRDPKLFSIILNYLRTNDLSISDNDNVDMSALKHEAMFYQLTSLVLKIDLVAFGTFNECGNILFQGSIDSSEPNNLGIKLFTSDQICQRSTTVNNHRSCLSADLSRTRISDDLLSETNDVHLRSSYSPSHLRTSSHIQTSTNSLSSENEDIKCNNRNPKNNLMDTKYIEGHPVNNQVTIIKCFQKWMAVCYPFTLSLYWHCDINGWRCVWKSDPTKNGGIIHKLAISSKTAQVRRNTVSMAQTDATGDETNSLVNEALVAVASGGIVTLYNVLLNIMVKRLVEYNIIPLNSNVTSVQLSQFSLNSSLIDHLVFLGGHLFAISESHPTFGFWQCQSQRWHNCSVNTQINCYSVVSDEFIILGCDNGAIYQLNAQKFPLRMSDNAVLYTEMFRDPSNDSITALDIFDNSQKCCSHVTNCLEIAYGTASGKIRIVVQHAGVNEGPKIFQTLTVHRSKIIRVNISEKYLISMCENMGHIRSWLISRFRGTINTQPGTQTLASFHLLSLDLDAQAIHPAIEDLTPPSSHTDDYLMLFQQVQGIARFNTDVGPHTDNMIFIQKLLPQSDRLFVRLAPTGKRICSLRSKGNLITAFVIHQSDIGGCVNLITGHDDGSLQMWDLSTAIDQNSFNELPQPPTAASVVVGQTSHCLRGVGVVNNDQRNLLLGLRSYPSIDEPSECGPTPRELFFMLRDYDLTLDRADDNVIKLTHSMSYQSLQSETSSKNNTIQRLQRVKSKQI